MNNVWSPEIDVVLSVGYSLESVGIKNWALDSSQALASIGKFESSGVAILGGDVYHLIGGRVEHTYDNWYCEKKIGESDLEFLKRSLLKAKLYIENYQVGGALFALVPLICR